MELLLFLCRAVDIKVTIAKNTGIITIAWLVGVGTKVTIFHFVLFVTVKHAVFDLSESRPSRETCGITPSSQKLNGNELS